MGGICDIVGNKGVDISLLYFNKISPLSKMASSQPVQPPVSAAFEPFMLYGAGNISAMDLFNTIYGNKWVQSAIAVGLCLLLAFEHELHVFSRRESFWILLIITVAMTMTEFSENAGLVLLMVALTTLSFNLVVNKETPKEK